jgi:hypothetical protein
MKNLNDDIHNNLAVSVILENESSLTGSTPYRRYSTVLTG